MAAHVVFGCDDLRGEILSYIPKRCKECKQKMRNKVYNHNKKLYNDYKWKNTRNKKMPNYCNWCVYYVFELNI